MTVTVFCKKPGCDRSWPRDPVLEVECPTCRAGVGVKCRRPSGHPIFAGGVHAERDLAADRQGHYGPCPSGRCGAPDPEAELRALWTAQGVPADRQDALIADITAKAQPGAAVGPFRVPYATEPTDQGNQLVIPGCEHDRSRGPDQMDLFR